MPLPYTARSPRHWRAGPADGFAVTVYSSAEASFFNRRKHAPKLHPKQHAVEAES
ncbi:hypothetical protein B0T26DRAFT_729127 [Lasiosphaeria miniovina]|uniref:Uncharacterized protein n=1 Tax=Lasiosphaeria miniovina TaxID=1954250 RepID=A0AA40DL09_9PEZI|nr:uncharacterized protein B0T26DRAFT_729127 [Lasiosphaeria miniovina]KAK0707105.1 hypothetical protein B0T26DRAFT_729127 [Lasiosphaeria miniovina]